MGRRPIWGVIGIFFLRFAEEKLGIEPLCSLYSDWPTDDSVLLYSNTMCVNGGDVRSIVDGPTMLQGVVSLTLSRVLSLALVYIAGL